MSKSTCLIFALPDLTCQGAELILSLCDRRPVREDGAQPCLLLHARVQVVVNLLVMMTMINSLLLVMMTMMKLMLAIMTMMNSLLLVMAMMKSLLMMVLHAPVQDGRRLAV